MKATCESDVNRKKCQFAEQLLTELFQGCLRRGYFGTIGIEVTVQDGTIQSVRQKREQLHR